MGSSIPEREGVSLTFSLREGSRSKAFSFVFWHLATAFKVCHIFTWGILFFLVSRARPSPHSPFWIIVSGCRRAYRGVNLSSLLTCQGNLRLTCHRRRGGWSTSIFVLWFKGHSSRRLVRVSLSDTSWGNIHFCFCGLLHHTFLHREQTSWEIRTNSLTGGRSMSSCIKRLSIVDLLFIIRADQTGTIRSVLPEQAPLLVANYPQISYIK